MTVLAGTAAGPGARRLVPVLNRPGGMVRGRCRRLSSRGTKNMPTVSLQGGDRIPNLFQSKIFAAISRKMEMQPGLQCAGSWRDTGQCRGLAPACHSSRGQKRHTGLPLDELFGERLHGCCLVVLNIKDGVELGDLQ
jgi:hypothetical protein